MDDVIVELGRPAQALPGRAPQPLQELQAWVCWKYELEPGDAKPRKVPYWANGGRRHGRHGRPEDRRQLVTFDQAVEAARRRGMTGVGLALLEDWGVCAVDFDDCVDAEGAVRPDVLQACAGTYAELSPSRTGVRAFVHGTFGNRKDHDAGFEVFSSAGFVTVTGNVLPVVELLGLEDTIGEPAPALRAFVARSFGREETGDAGDNERAPLGLDEAQLRQALEVLDPSMRHDPWLKVGMALHHETRGEGFPLWDEWSAGGAQYPGTDVLRARWDSMGRGGQRPVTAHWLVRQANERGARIDLLTNAADDFDVLEPKAETAPRPPRFRFVPAHEFAAGVPPSWIVKGLVPEAEVMLLYGASQAGKSFFALDLLAAIARGVPWRGRRTKRGGVAYIAAEGAAGLRKRLQAYERHHGVALREVGLSVLAGVPNLLKTEDAVELARGVQFARGARVIAVDTLAQTTPGANENAGEDMGLALANCRRLHHATGALVLLIHHTGKDLSKGARGWSGLRAAVDAEIEVVRVGGERVARLTKQKDGEDGAEFCFRLHQVAVGVDEDGEVVTSCVVEHVETAPALAPREPQGAWERLVWRAVMEMVGTGRAASAEEVVDIAAVQAPKPEPEKRDRRREYARRALEGLIERAFLCKEGDEVRLPHAAPMPHEAA